MTKQRCAPLVCLSPHLAYVVYDIYFKAAARTVEGTLRHGSWQVFCNGEEVLTVSGTKEKYVVDVWSGNHPFYLVRCLVTGASLV